MSARQSLMARRHFLITSALVGAGGLIIPSVAHAESAPLPDAQTISPTPTTSTSAAGLPGALLAATAATAQASGDGSIRPFHYRASDNELADLKRRVAATRWPERETVNDTTQGVRLATMQKLADYWAKHHDWSRAEAQLFSYPNFITNIDGLDVHFIHVKSKHANALPVIITHGWPGSIIEQLKIIGPLTDPTAYGGTAADAFDIVIPSLPGYGFSG
ncbi:epoxide hydrolase N-terminal domain-containing protein, partial [Sphingomonas sp. URHD0057]|uniref:epoxide hydrolase N-terminal domain-containing protein n=1 Tax=Sphingomonas sp. URHD0057 TaxID=1380389 RepID=UPI001E2D4C5E